MTSTYYISYICIVGPTVAPGWVVLDFTEDDPEPETWKWLQLVQQEVYKFSQVSDAVKAVKEIDESIYVGDPVIISWKRLKEESDVQTLRSIP